MILFKNYLDKEFCKGVISYGEEKGFQRGLVKEGDEELTVRKSNVHFIQWPIYNSPFIHDLYFNLDYKVKETNAHLFGFHISFLDPLQITKYEGKEKGFYDWHIDAMQEPIPSTRKISFSLLLNDSDEYEGGNLEFKAPFEEQLHQAGDLIIFSSFEEHRVTPVTKGTRYSLVGWMRGPLLR